MKGQSANYLCFKYNAYCTYLCFLFKYTDCENKVILVLRTANHNS